MSDVTGYVRQVTWTASDGEEQTGWQYSVELAKVAGHRRRVRVGGFRTKKQKRAAARARMRTTHATRTCATCRP